MASILAVGFWLVAGSAPASASADFRRFLDGLWPEAEASRVSRATFDRELAGLTPDLTLPDLALPGREKSVASGQAEFTRPPQAYIDRGQVQRLAEQGRALARQHAAVLARIEREIGVEGAAVLAIWGRETAYGAYKPPHDAVRVLATQAFVGRRKDIFRKELVLALKLIEDRRAARAEMKASWAGAMGLTQFLPSEVYDHGVDFDGDGRIDLFRSVPDALASAARQLKAKGWKTGVPWGLEVRLSPRVDCAFEGPTNERPVADWAKEGVARVKGEPFPVKLIAEPAYLMSPGGALGPSFLVTENYKVFRRYNMSDLYATFVGHLADRITGGGDFVTPWRDIAQLREAEVAEIQQRLGAIGLGVDKVDGKIGSNTRLNIGLYQRRSGMAVDCWPSAAVLAKARGVRTQ
jgi:lytic murein transglycosylase